MATTPSNLQARATFPKTARRPYSAPKDSGISPEQVTTLSGGGPTGQSAMIIRASKQLTTTTKQFVERYGVTPPFFVRCCLLPGLLAVTRFECFYRGAIVDTLEVPAWKTRLRALRTIFGMADAEKIAEKHIKVPFGALGTGQLATIADAFRETDWCWITAEFLVKNCLTPALEAFNTALLFNRGRVVDSLRIQDSATHVEALKIAFKIHKAYPSEHDNTQFATYRDIALLASAARRNNRAIHIVRQTQLVYLR